jgi:hypothetical protein
MMPGVRFVEIRNQVVDAYTFSELDIVLRERMNVRIDRVVGSGNFDHVVFQLLGWAERSGREVEFIRVTSGARQDRAGMRSVSQKSGMAVPVLLQQQGQPLVQAPLPVTDSGFEAKVKSYLSFLDVAVWREQLARLEGRVCRVEVGNGKMGTGFADRATPARATPTESGDALPCTISVVLWSIPQGGINGYRSG